MLFIAYAFKGHVHAFAGRVKVVSHSSCRTSSIFIYFCPLKSIVKMTSIALQTTVEPLTDKVTPFARADPEGGTGGPADPSLKNHKNIGFLSNSGPDPLKRTKLPSQAFNVGPSSARQRNAI